MPWQICERKKSRGGSGSRRRKPAAGISLSRKPTGLQCWQLPCWRHGRQFVMNQSTFDTGIDGMEDKNGQPIGRTNYGVNGEETYRFMGKNVETVEDDVLPSWDDANEGDVIAVFMNFSDYVINTNMEMQVVKWTDHDNNKIKNKCLMVVDGKVADAAGIILVKKGVTAV